MTWTRRLDGWRTLPLLAGLVASLGAVGGPSSAGPPPHRHQVAIRGMAFVPSTLTIQRGDTVVWLNEDIVPHTATGSAAPRWSTGTLLHAQRGEFVARDTGMVDYTCEFHPTMRGRLTVR